MRTLLIVAGLFFSICGAFVVYFATSDPGHEYDLKLVLPIDIRQMPKPVLPPPVVSRASDAGPLNPPPADGRAEAGSAPVLPARPPVLFDERPGAASEGRAPQ